MPIHMLGGVAHVSQTGRHRRPDAAAAHPSGNWRLGRPAFCEVG